MAFTFFFRDLPVLEYAVDAENAGVEIFKQRFGARVFAWCDGTMLSDGQGLHSLFRAR